jgi:hypothetical protein
MKKLAVLALVLVMVGMASAQDFEYMTAPSFVTGTTGMVNTTIEPILAIVFGDPEVGRITWGSGEIRFEGNFDESARMFFEYFWKNYALEGCQ